MTTKQDLIDYINSLAQEQIERMISRLILFGRCLEITDAQAVFTDTLIGKLLGI